MSSEAPIFVVGSSRSGTSVLRKSLGSHSGLFAPIEETNFYFDMWGNRSSYEEKEMQVASFLEQFAIVQLFSEDKSWLGLPVEEVADHLQSKGIRSVTELFAEGMCFAADKQADANRWVEKSPYHALVVPQLKALYPTAKFVFIVRDGREVAASIWGRTGTPKSVENLVRGATEWKNSVNTVHRALEASLALTKDTVVIRYEDLVASPEETMNKVCRAVELQFEPQMLAFSYSNSSFGDVRDQQKEQRGITARASKWEKEFAGTEIAGVIEWWLRPELERYGYQREGGAPSAASKLGCFREYSRLRTRYAAKRAFARTGRSGQLRQMLGMTPRA